MDYIFAADTDIGTSKEINQDSICIKTAKTESDYAALILVCDGMGGLTKGEIASASVVKAFSDWFEKRLPDVFESWNLIKRDICELLNSLNTKIVAYGMENKLQLGTTATGMLVINSKYITFHVGDTRIYKLATQLDQMTEDHTFVEQEMKLGRMTADAAASDPRRNALTQCIGAAGGINPEIKFGNIESGANYLFCSDGLHHTLQPSEILANLSPRHVTTKTAMKIKMRSLIDTVKERGERDNISAAMFRAEF